MSKKRSISVSKRRGKRDPSRSIQKASIRALLEDLRSSGRYTFTRGEALRALGASGVALKNATWRLSKAGRLVSPRRGFYIIVPPEYRAAGSIPPSWIIRDLMAYLGRPYYVGLLSAAALHGAAHQVPHEFQVVTDRPLRATEVGRTRVVFVKKAHLEKTPTVSVKTPTGEIRVSSPEATALDLVRYPEHAGSLSNVATVLDELAERLDPHALARAAQAEEEVAYAQRLGYLLDLTGHTELTGPLAEWVHARASRVTPLRSDRPITGALRAPRWKVAMNEEIDFDRARA